MRHTLGGLGVSETEENLYRHLIRRPGIPVGAAAGDLGMAENDLARALDRLKALGMLQVQSDGLCVPSDPMTAVDRLVERRLRDLHEEMQHVTASRRLGELLADELAEERGGGARRFTGQGIERIEGQQQVRERIDELSFFAREEILSTQPGGPLTPDIISAARPLDGRVLRRGLVMRTVVRADAAEHPASLAYFSELVSRGAEIKVAESAVERMLIYDRSVALAPIDPQNSKLGALIVREPGLVAGMIALFERIWQGAAELRTDAEPDGGGLTEIEAQVLAAMCRVEKDEIGAKEVGVSVRTYRRHAAELMQRLDAVNRCQAALFARDRGWI